MRDSSPFQDVCQLQHTRDPCVDGLWDFIHASMQCLWFLCNLQLGSCSSGRWLSQNKLLQAA